MSKLERMDRGEFFWDLFARAGLQCVRDEPNAEDVGRNAHVRGTFVPVSGEDVVEGGATLREISVLGEDDVAVMAAVADDVLVLGRTRR
jgi:hypothetical protein